MEDRWAVDKVEFYYLKKILVRSFGRTKLHKKGSRNIFFYLRKLSLFDVNVLVLH